MKPSPFSKPPVLALGVILAALLAGCGGGTKTETVADTPLPEATTTTPTTPKAKTSTTTTPATTPTSTTTTSSEHGGTSAPTTTRTATAPAFTHEGTPANPANTTAEGLSGAEAVLRANGYTASATSDYHPNQTLRVLVGTHAGSAEGSGQQAFFFVDGRYIGTDSKQPSASIHVVNQSDTEVTLAYALPGSPGAGQATVHFQLNNGKLLPLNSIPPASSRR